MISMRTNSRTLAAGFGAAGVLGLGLYIAVPASAADPSPSPSTSTTAQPDDPRWDHPSRWDHGRRGPGGHGHGPRGPGGHGVHGEATVRDGDDNFRLVTFQHGEITAVSSATLTVKSDDGASWTWTTDDDTRVREDHDDAALKDLAKGDEIRVAGERSGDTRTAKFIHVRD